MAAPRRAGASSSAPPSNKQNGTQSAPALWNFAPDHHSRPWRRQELSETEIRTAKRQLVLQSRWSTMTAKDVPPTDAQALRELHGSFMRTKRWRYQRRDLSKAQWQDTVTRLFRNPWDRRAYDESGTLVDSKLRETMRTPGVPPPGVVVGGETTSEPQLCKELRHLSRAVLSSTLEPGRVARRAKGQRAFHVGDAVRLEARGFQDTGTVLGVLEEGDSLKVQLSSGEVVGLPSVYFQHDGSQSAPPQAALALAAAWSKPKKEAHEDPAGRREAGLCLREFWKWIQSAYEGQAAKAFEELDSNNCGVLSRAQLQQRCQELGFCGDVRTPFRVLDTDKSGGVTLNEFLVVQSVGKREEQQEEQSDDTPSIDRGLKKMVTQLFLAAKDPIEDKTRLFMTREEQQEEDEDNMVRTLSTTMGVEFFEVEEILRSFGRFKNKDGFISLDDFMPLLAQCLGIRMAVLADVLSKDRAQKFWAEMAPGKILCDFPTFFGWYYHSPWRRDKGDSGQTGRKSGRLQGMDLVTHVASWSERWICT
mmetsp:Transcript_44542/g.117796  ORF Transcript_44542/g.117796 Transcript_44542/m.117796 type:complete len:533 (-) Transcript_44542:43-1641(-)